jgi:hypothetical protein
MSKLIITTVLALAALAVVANSAEAAGRGRCGPTYAVAPGPVAVAPTSAAPATTAQAGTGYRSFSYQPVQPAAVMPAPMYRSYSTPRMQSWDFPKTDARRYSNVR